MQRRHHSLAGALAICLVLFTSSRPQAQAPRTPELPRATVDVTMPVQTGRVIAVPVGGDFQAALNAAVPGDTITLVAGAAYAGTFTLPLKTGAGWIVIRSSAPDSQLPAPGERVTPAFAAALPKLVATSVSPALTTAAGAHHYRLVGIEITVAPTAPFNYGLVTLGDSWQTSLVQVPYALVLDRVYVHGSSTMSLRRGIGLNSASTAIVDSWISDVHEAGADAQAIAGWSGPGPFRIENCYLEGAGENLLFGGSDPAIANLVPSDITIRRNLLSKPAAWKTSAWTVKNVLELKNAQRVLIDGNIIEHNWLAGQNGYAVLFTVRNQDGTAPWSVVQDVTFTNNRVRRVSSGINILGRDNLHPSQPTTRIRVANNLFTEVDSTAWGGYGRLIQVLDGVSDLTVEHNTALQSGEILVASGAATSNLVFRNNIANAGGYGIGGDATFGNPTLTLSTFFPGALFTYNALIGAYGPSYPAGNAFPATVADVGFISPPSNYRLSAASPFKNAASDGTDLGVDMDALDRPIGPVDTIAPQVSVTAPSAGSTVSGTATVSLAATDNIAVAGVWLLLDGAAVGGDMTNAPYAAQLVTTFLANGTHTLAATARDAAGNVGTSAAVTMTVKNAAPPDTMAPVVSVTAPAAGTVVSGTVTVSVAATDNIAVAGVRLSLDGAALGSELTAAPYAAQLVTTGLADGPHTLVATARDAAGNIGTSAPVTLTVKNAPAVPPGGTAPFPGTAVTWTRMTKVVASSTPGSLVKQGGCDGCPDAGASSTLTVGTAVGGYLEWVVPETATQKVVGLGVNDTSTSEADVEVAIKFWPGGRADLRLAGVYKGGETAYAAGDVFRITVQGTLVTFARNGRTYATLATTLTGPLAADTSFSSKAGRIDKATIASLGTIVPPPGGLQQVQWTSLVNTQASGADLSKTAGCVDCQDAGAVSTQVIAAGGTGFLQWTMADTSAQRVVGLGAGNTDTSEVDVDYALKFWPGGTVDVREAGRYLTETRYAAGDVFRVAVQAGVVTFMKNGNLVYRSATVIAVALNADTSFTTGGGRITQVGIQTTP